MRTLLLVVFTLAACRDSARRVAAELDTAPGVREGSEVTYLGVEIGKVDAIAFDRGRVRLTLAINRPDVPLRSGDRVRVLTTSMFGDRGVEIVPGPPDAPLLAADVILPPMPPDSLAEARRAVAEAVAAQLGEQVGAMFRRDSGTTGKRDTARRDTTSQPPSR